jgi:hypothetical protein
MQRSSIFWGSILIFIGGIFLLDSLGLFGEINLWNIVWPSFLILLGMWAILGYRRGRQPVEVEELALPLEGAQAAKVGIKFGAGRLQIGAGAAETELVNGQFGGGVAQRVRREGDRTVADLRLPSQGFPIFIMPWNWGRWTGFDWTVNLNPEITLELVIDTGASEARLDLADLKVSDLKVNTGASSTEITLPSSAGHTRVEVEAGAASVGIQIPTDVAAQIRAGGALVGITVDKDRFPREGTYYQSPDFESAENKVEIKVNVGAGSVDVR